MMTQRKVGRPKGSYCVARMQDKIMAQKYNKLKCGEA
jgi:hypothetical protein